ncbi:MAG: hypothetical protein KDA92_07350 [Planctomycetales bacterium]|nr:hypothetical protein [Planctomycetales bacterium]
MSTARPDQNDEVEQLLLNARLRDELEPFLDESVEVVNTRCMPTRLENEYLASMLAWERAPVLPISHWFQPELRLPHPDSRSDSEVRQLLWETIEALHSKQIVLDFTDHLCDRDLYRLIYRDILPSLEKKIERTNTYLHWQCIDVNDNPDVWLRYYATEEEREIWQDETGGTLPPSEDPPYPRRMPRWPL